MTKEELIQDLGNRLNLNVSRETLDALALYKDLLQEWNDKINLTAITDDEGIFLKHFADSMMIFQSPAAKQAITVIDVGTGAGFPGLVMKILRPEIELTLLDPLQKRLNFLDEVVKQLKLSKVSLIHGRAEDVSRETSYRDHYDLAVSRAVAILPTLMEFCLPFVRPSGHFIALKGPGIAEEIQLNKSLHKELGAKDATITLLDSLDEMEHNLVSFEKMKETPNKYPRKFTQIKKDNERYKSRLDDKK